MVVTTDDVEQELQEEFARLAKKKNAQKGSDPSWLPDFLPQRVLLLLGAGMTCAAVLLVFPQILSSGQFLAQPEITLIHPGDSSGGNKGTDLEKKLKKELEASKRELAKVKKVAAAEAQRPPADDAASSDDTADVEGAPADDTAGTDDDAAAVGSAPTDDVAASASGEDSKAEPSDGSASAENVLEWVISTTCQNGKGVNCAAVCKDQGLQCDLQSLKSVDSSAKMKAAVHEAGGLCAEISKVGIGGDWDGPHVNSGECQFTPSKEWKPSCTSSPTCGWARLCACSGDRSAGKGPQKFRTAKQAPLMWWDVADRVPKAIMGDWASETVFLDRVLRSFGKLQPGYRGPQKLFGFQPGKIFDDQGMFAMDASIRSVAIDVGAATNPLPFDLPIDNSQVAFFVEPVQWKSIEESLEGGYQGLKGRGGCGKFFEAGICAMDRALVFPAAVSEKLSHASFHVTANPYCGSLEAFTGAAKIRNAKDPDVKGIFDQCYKDAARTRKVATVSLKAIIERIPKGISIKYVKIDAQGHDYKVLLSAGDQMSRIEYVRFEMQVDPPPDYKLVKDVPSYAEVKEHLESLGFKHDGQHACFFDPGASRFSLVVKEMECVFCRKRPCIENGRAPLGPRPHVGDAQKPYVQPGPWTVPAGMDTKEPASPLIWS